jgi:hypothetical protein
MQLTSYKDVFLFLPPEKALFGGTCSSFLCLPNWDELFFFTSLAFSTKIRRRSDLFYEKYEMYEFLGPSVS